MWGSELKCTSADSPAPARSLPLCEVVSWNVRCLDVFPGSDRSTSVRGSELKYRQKYDELQAQLSTSVWGSELKYPYFRQLGESGTSLPQCEVVSWNTDGATVTNAVYSLPLCEVVSWNYTLSRCSFSVKWSTSVWGSELNVFEGSMWYCRFNPMMGKSGPQTFRACCTYSRSVVPERITVLI